MGNALERVDHSDYIAEELQKFNITNAAIENMRRDFMGLTVANINDRLGLKRVHDARLIVKSKRVEVEKTRKMLKEDSLRFGRMVDGEAKRITALLEPIETHLATEEDRIEDEKERIRQAQIAERRLKLNKRIEDLMSAGRIKIDVLAVTDMTDQEFDNELAQARLEFQAEKQRKEQLAKEAKEKEKETQRRIKAMAEYGIYANPEYISQMNLSEFDVALSMAKSNHEESQAKKAAEDKRRHEESLRLAEEKKALEAKALEIQRMEEAVRKEKVAIEALRIKEEQERIAQETAKQQAEAETIRIEQERIDKERFLKEEAEMREKLLPDFKKLEMFASLIEGVPRPQLQNEESRQIFKVALELIIEGCSLLRGASL